tara:strand:+ start:1558 stop:1728 length:171 start_codon:yes stop_codon:yes gene_type:complete
MSEMVFLKLSRARQVAALALVALVLGASVLSAGCGQKGPLYLPETPASEESEDSDS